MLDRKTTAAAGTADHASRSLALSEISKFTALAALLAIFVDAAIAHAMLWGNDPYWTYWVTDTLLMATVFAVGTAWIGIGLAQGALVTAVHMVLLTIYYWSFSPIGLPSQPEWLDLEHTWVTGLPVHFAVYYLGYVVALWLWRHHRDVAPQGSTARQAAMGVGVAIAVVVVAGLLQALMLGQSPGVTWFVMRIAVASAFTLAWWSLAGRDRAAAVSGGIVLGFLLVAYGHYLGPVGLPNSEFRILAENPPPAEVNWLSYRQEFMVILPMTILLSVFGYVLMSRANTTGVKWGRSYVLTSAASALALAVLGGLVALYTGPDANTAVITAGGPAGAAQTDANGGSIAPADATLRMRVEDRNIHRTPLPPHDFVDIEASFSSSDGRTYLIRAVEPMVAEPRGRFTTWHGVGFNVWHHGRSGIGYAGLPATKSKIAVYALGTVSSGGQVLAVDAPIHVLTSSRDGAHLELHVGEPGSSVPGIPDGYLRVLWPEYQGGHGPALSYARYAWGGGVLVVLLGFAVAAVRREQEASANNGGIRA